MGWDAGVSGGSSRVSRAVAEGASETNLSLLEVRLPLPILSFLFPADTPTRRLRDAEHTSERIKWWMECWRRAAMWLTC